MKLTDALARLEGVGRCANGYVACCPAHGDRNASLSIREADGKLLVYCFAGCDYDSIIAALHGRHGRHASGLPAGTHRVVDDAKRTELSLRIWREAQPATGTLVQAYLRSRRITASIPVSLRFHPNLLHPTGVHLPAMVAAVQSVDGSIVAIHRTYLRSEGTGKANVEPQKMMLGPCAGGAVRFADPASTIAVAEGIETALSIAEACPDLPTWAALSASGLRALRLPDTVGEVIICADNDANRAGERAAEAAARRLMREGRRVSIARPTRANDFNDLLRI